MHTCIRVYIISVWQIRRVHKSRWIFDSGDDTRSRRMCEICRASSCISDYSINRNPVHAFDMVSRTFFQLFCGFATLPHGPNAHVKTYMSNASIHYVDYTMRNMCGVLNVSFFIFRALKFYFGKNFQKLIKKLCLFL